MRLFLIAPLLLLVSLALPAEEQPAVTAPSTTPALAPAPDLTPAPVYTAFPGFWFDFLPDVVSADNSFELKLRLGLPTRPALRVDYLAADGQCLSRLEIPNPTTADDFAQGKLAVLSVPVEANPQIARLLLTAGDCQTTVELRAPADNAADLLLAALPNRDRPATADHLVALAQSAPAAPPPPAAAWATLGAHLCARNGHPVILRTPPRSLETDRSGLITGPFHPSPTDSLPAARHRLLLLPAPLFDRLKPWRTWTAATAAALAAIPAPGTPAPAPPTAATTAVAADTPTTRLIAYPTATPENPFHPIAACLAAALAALDDPAYPPAERLIVILPWDDAAYGTDPREFALAIDTLADHFRARRHAPARALTDLVFIGPFRHPSVPEKRHTMLESHVTERRRAQGFSWPELSALNTPAMWRLNPVSEPVALYATLPADAGINRLKDRLQPLLDQPGSPPPAAVPPPSGQENR